VRSPEAPRLAQLLRAGGRTVTTEDSALTVHGASAAAVGHEAFAAGIELHELRAESSGLEEIYFRLTSGQEQFAAGGREGAR
jgi:ABC-2 type transport system ATP-binding protein